MDLHGEIVGEARREAERKTKEIYGCRVEDVELISVRGADAEVRVRWRQTVGCGEV